MEKPESSPNFCPCELWLTASGARRLAARLVPWNGRGRRLVEQTEGCYSEGDSQGLPGYSNPRILGIPTISFSKLYPQKMIGSEFGTGSFLSNYLTVGTELGGILCLFLFEERGPPTCKTHPTKRKEKETLLTLSVQTS